MSGDNSFEITLHSAQFNKNYDKIIATYQMGHEYAWENKRIKTTKSLRPHSGLATWSPPAVTPVRVKDRKKDVAKVFFSEAHTFTSDTYIGELYLPLNEIKTGETANIEATIKVTGQRSASNCKAKFTVKAGGVKAEPVSSPPPRHPETHHPEPVTISSSKCHPEPKHSPTPAHNSASAMVHPEEHPEAIDMAVFTNNSSTTTHFPPADAAPWSPPPQHYYPPPYAYFPPGPPADLVGGPPAPYPPPISPSYPYPPQYGYPFPPPAAPNPEFGSNSTPAPAPYPYPYPYGAPAPGSSYPPPQYPYPHDPNGPPTITTTTSMPPGQGM